MVFPGYCKRLHAGLVATAVRSAGVGWGGSGRGGGSGPAGSRQSNAQSCKAEGACGMMQRCRAALTGAVGLCAFISH